LVRCSVTSMVLESSGDRMGAGKTALPSASAQSVPKLRAIRDGSQPDHDKHLF
jgi:hypothetical protein